MKHTLNRCLLLITMIFSQVKSNCNDNQILFIKDNNEVECRDCPNDCAVCFRSV